MASPLSCGSFQQRHFEKLGCRQSVCHQMPSLNCREVNAQSDLELLTAFWQSKSMTCEVFWIGSTAVVHLSDILILD